MGAAIIPILQKRRLLLRKTCPGSHTCHVWEPVFERTSSRSDPMWDWISFPDRRLMFSLEAFPRQPLPSVRSNPRMMHECGSFLTYSVQGCGLLYTEVNSLFELEKFLLLLLLTISSSPFPLFSLSVTHCGWVRNFWHRQCLVSSRSMFPFFYLKVSMFLSFYLYSGDFPWLCHSAILLKFKFGDPVFVFLISQSLSF